MLQHLTKFFSSRIVSKTNESLPLFGYIGVTTGDVYPGIWIDLVHSGVFEILRLDITQKCRPNAWLSFSLAICPNKKKRCNEHACDSDFSAIGEKPRFFGC